MRKVILVILVFISVLALGLRFGYQPLIESLGLKPRAGIRVEANQKANVFINDKLVGQNPYQDENLTEGEYLVSLKSEDATSGAVLWQGYVKLAPGTLSVVNREVSNDSSGSSGEVITLDKGKGVTVISNPTQAEVIIDGKSYGVTPVSISDISAGEHQFLIGKDSFLKRSIRATSVDGFNLTLNVDLALSEADLTRVPTVSQTSSAQGVVKNTPTGFLRVRSGPSTNAEEISRVAVGETLTIMEEANGWIKVKLSDGKEGYVAAEYIEKKS